MIEQQVFITAEPSFQPLGKDFQCSKCKRMTSEASQKQLRHVFITYYVNALKCHTVSMNLYNYYLSIKNKNRARQGDAHL